MVKINRIYTRTGDDGSTGLVGGKRVPKDSARVEAYGDVDELNSVLGLARTLADRKPSRSNAALAKIRTILEMVQNDLFDVGAELATPAKEIPRSRKGKARPRFSDGLDIQVQHMESWIDDLTRNLPELRSFVLPGGTELNATLHLARTVCRRAERRALALSRKEFVAKSVLRYLNRLSDLLFAMARAESRRVKMPEYLWKPGQANQKTSRP